MGGMGSGRRSIFDTKDTTESQRRVDIRFLKKQGWLYAGAAGLLSWTCNGEQSGFINYRIESERIILSYRFRVRGGEWSDVQQTVYFDRTPCNYGGCRYWFLCPGCGRRIALLYGAGKYFLCRHCYGLAYATQQEDCLSRLMTKARKIRRRLGASEALDMPILWKPKSMHQKTFDRLRFRAMLVEEHLDRGLVAKFGGNFIR